MRVRLVVAKSASDGMRCADELSGESRCALRDEATIPDGKFYSVSPLPQAQFQAGEDMYLAKLTIENFRCFGEDDKRFEMSLRPGLTALVGENEAGKTAVMDALRFALGTTDQEWYRLEDTDFHQETERKKIEVPADAEGDPTPSANDKTTAEMELLANAGGDPTVKIACEFRGLRATWRPARVARVMSISRLNFSHLPRTRLETRDWLTPSILPALVCGHVYSIRDEIPALRSG